jgi:hypothetical protein
VDRNEKDGSRTWVFKKLLSRLREPGPLQRHMFPAAIGVSTGIVVGVCAVEVIGLSAVAGAAVGIIAGGYAFTKAWEVLVVRLSMKPAR